MTTEYVQRLVSAHPAIGEVWLFGSRANGTARDDSDWDYLVFSDDGSLLNSLYVDAQRFHVRRIDLFVVAASYPIAMKPWADERQKMLNLNDDPGNLAWTVVPDNDSVAEYTETKERDPPPIAVDVRWRRAVRVYPWPIGT